MVYYFRSVSTESTFGDINTINYVNSFALLFSEKESQDQYF